MMGERRVMQEALFYGFSLERHVPDNHTLRQDRPFRRPVGGPGASGALLQRDGSSFDRSRADDPDADRRLLLRHSESANLRQNGFQVASCVNFK